MIKKKKYKRINNDLQNIHIKLKIVTRTPLKPGGELMCSGMIDSSCSTSDTCRVKLLLITCCTVQIIYVLGTKPYKL